MYFLVILIVVIAVGIFFNKRAKNSGLKNADKQKEQARQEINEERERMAAHYQTSETVKDFAGKLSAVFVKYIRSCFEKPEEQYDPQMLIRIYYDKINYQSEHIFYDYTGSIALAEENVKDLDNYNKLLALGDVFSEMIPHLTAEQIPVGPDGEPGSSFVDRVNIPPDPHRPVEKPYFHGPYVQLEIKFHYTDRDYAAQKKEL